jgi:hypothetical protein
MSRTNRKLPLKRFPTYLEDERQKGRDTQLRTERRGCAHPARCAMATTLGVMEFNYTSLHIGGRWMPNWTTR